MSKIALYICLFVLGVCEFGNAHASTPLEDAMSEEEQLAAGLNKLTDEEKRYLSTWLLARETLANDGSNLELNEGVTATQINLSVVDPSEVFGKEQISAPSIKALRGRLRGSFDGWDGDTKFRLDNGQVWQQRVGGQYKTAQRTQPEVVIEKGRFGYYLRMVETGRRVGVRRIK